MQEFPVDYVVFHSNSMKILLFWQNWSRSERFLYLTAFGLLKISLLLLLFFHYRGIENSIEWKVLSELDEVPVKLDSLQVSGQQSARTVESLFLLGKTYILKEQFVPVQIDLPEWLGRGYLAGVLAGFVLLLAAISGLPRRWYIGMMMLVITLLSLSHLEMLQLFGTDNTLGFGLVAAVVVFVSYYLHAFRENMPMVQRVFLFSGVIAVLVGVFSVGAQAPVLSLTATSYSLLPMIPLSVLFIGWLSVEIIAGFVYVVTNSRTGFGKTSLYNFLFLGGLYMFSIYLLYLKVTRQTEAAFWYFSPFVLYGASLLLGIWSFAKRTEAFLPFREIGAWLYLGLGLITTTVMAFVLFTHNNSFIEVFEDLIVYSQLCIGTLFIAYIGLNFWPLFKQGKAVHKVMYKPMRFLQSQAWMIGGMAWVALMALHRFYTIDQAQAGYYNSLGDLHTVTKEWTVAGGYYQQALDTDFQNHKSAFALASLALRQGDAALAGAFFQQALQKDPTPQAYAGLGQTLLNENLFFDAIFNLRKGLTTFPKSGELQNNLGFLYSRTAIADSAYYYLELARQHVKEKEVTESNLLAFWAKALTISSGKGSLAALGLTKKDFEETHLLDQPTKNLSHEANRLAVAQLIKATIDPLKVELGLPKDSALSVNNFAYLYNYTQYTKDSSQAKLLKKLVNTGNNGTLYHELQLAQAYAEYQHDKLAAMDILASEIMSDTSQKVALARQMLDYWLIKEARPSFVNLANLKIEADYQNAIRQHPFDSGVLGAATTFFNQQKKPKVAYDALLNALRFRRNAPELQKLYVLQCLKLYLTDFAEEGLQELTGMTSSTDYQAFLKIYQAQRALIEKERESFR